MRKTNADKSSCILSQHEGEGFNDPWTKHNSFEAQVGPYSPCAESAGIGT
jgi:hypothetical protein